MNENKSNQTTILKQGDVKINVHSNFISDTNLCDILFSIANMKLKEKSA